jgi:hypothetical protein
MCGGGLMEGGRGGRREGDSMPHKASSCVPSCKRYYHRTIYWSPSFPITRIRDAAPM